MTARDEVLERVRRALADAPAPAPVPRDYSARRHETPDQVLDRFAERVEDYHAVVVRCGEDEVESQIARALPAGATTVVPQGFLWTVRGAKSDAGLSAGELDRVDAVVTTATVGIADTGTIVMTHGPGEGRRAITLVPDLHVCVLRVDQVVPDLLVAVPLLDPRGPTTWISGPSATSDIELERVEGVHGPRTLHVVLVG